MIRPSSLSHFLRSALLDSRPIEIQLIDGANLPDIEEVVRILAERVQDLYRSLGGQDIEAKTEEREGTLVIRMRPRDEADGEENVWK